MDLLPTAEQDEIVATVRSVLADHHTLGEPLNDSLWQAAADQGWFGLGLDESMGGVGYSIVEEALLFTELGRAAVPGPFLATVIAAHVAASEPNAATVAALVGGSDRAAMAEPFDAERTSVLDGPGSTWSLINDDDGLRLVATDDLGPADATDALDTLTPLALVDQRATASAPVVVSATNPEPLRLRATLLVAAMAAGIAEATAAQSVAYALDREQFGQPIGTFQAVKHRCTDMATRAEVAVCQVRYASLALRDGLTEAPFHIHAARVVAVRSAVENAEVNVQNHGGIGFTWEHTAHRYVTRARLLANQFGTPNGHLADMLSATAPA